MHGSCGDTPRMHMTGGGTTYNHINIFMLLCIHIYATLIGFTIYCQFMFPLPSIVYLSRLRLPKGRDLASPEPSLGREL
jgi:hypothetical protein